MERSILHSDMNCFYASVEAMLDPALRGKAIAVCGSQETRHGIVLAKSQLAKKAGVKTGMAIWQARECCRDLIVVPPQYDQYLKYSRLAHEIYLRYTDRMEPYGMDECWLDLTGCRLDPVATAEEIRATTKSELGLTVSIGVSFNKIFAKLGSDMKKPDAMTVITQDNFRELVWPLPASDLLYCGPATTRKLANYGIHTIGDIAATSPVYLRNWLGINGVALWNYAAGTDTSRVMTDGWETPIKSVGHGVTCVTDLLDEEEVWRVILELSQDVGHRLRVNGFLAKGVQITLRDNDLFYKQFQTTLEMATRSPKEIAEQCFALFKANYRWQNKVRAICVRAISLVPEKCPQQLTIFDDPVRREKQDKMDAAIEDIRRRYGKRAVYEKAHTPTNIDFLTERYLGLNVSYMRLSEDGSILGLTTYADVNVEFNRYGQNEIVAVRKDSVILEKDLLTGQNGRRRFTVAHEAAHQVVFRADRSGTAQMNYLKHLPNKQSYSLRELHGAEDWCEWQANTLGAALLMPARTVHFWMYRFNGNKPLVRYGHRFNYMDRGVLDNLINVLAVSRTALVIRLTQLGYICQRPESEYCDPLDIFPDPGEVF